jgi:hypothetical protein
MNPEVEVLWKQPAERNYYSPSRTATHTQTFTVSKLTVKSSQGCDSFSTRPWAISGAIYLHLHSCPKTPTDTRYTSV